MAKAKRLFEIANKLALGTPGFFESKGPGAGNLSTNKFIAKLGELAASEFGQDFSEQKICGNNSLAVDFYFPDEGVIVEIALGLKRPATEYEKDILKAVMAKSLKHKVDGLVFIGKLGAIKKCNQPGRTAVKEWLLQTHGIQIEVFDLG